MSSLGSFVRDMGEQKSRFAVVHFKKGDQSLDGLRTNLEIFCKQSLISALI